MTEVIDVGYTKVAAYIYGYKLPQSFLDEYDSMDEAKRHELEEKWGDEYERKNLGFAGSTLSELYPTTIGVFIDTTEEDRHGCCGSYEGTPQPVDLTRYSPQELEDMLGEIKEAISQDFGIDVTTVKPKTWVCSWEI